MLLFLVSHDFFLHDIPDFLDQYLLFVSHTQPFYLHTIPRMKLLLSYSPIPNIKSPLSIPTLFPFTDLNIIVDPISYP
jgi:hypothetical protein